ncbi:MAG TPA: MFS transporter [Burkholderiales bacterium]|nr:MFS transporter [Burkholderiales bacterium]
MSPAAASFRADAKVISLVGLAHGLSHFFQLVLPPLFPIVKDEFGVSYAALGAVMAVFYSVSGIAQTAAGFLVDRLGARVILLAGMVLVAAGAILTGLAPSFPWLFVAAAVGGLGNSVFHPADFALLNAKVSPSRLGHAFGVHGIVGNVGWIVAPVFVFPIAQAYGWRVALVAAGVVGLVAFGVLATQRDLGGAKLRPHAAAKGGGGLRADVDLLLSWPILTCFAFFALYAITLIGFQTFSTAALTQLYGVPLVVATTALTAFLVGGAVGILAGGFIAAHTDRHTLVTVAGMLIPALLAFVIATGTLPGGSLVAVMTMAGFGFGAMGPSRDIIVRGIAPEHARGKVYGFVYSGLDVGGLVGPLLFGSFLDHGRPAWVFVGAAVIMLLAIFTVAGVGRRPGLRAPARA